MAVDASNQYKETQVKTANQGELILMMYDGAIKFIRLALEGLSKKKYDEVNNNIIRAQDIITELMLSLNFEADETFAKKFFSLYTYMNRRLVEGNIKKDAQPMEEVMKYLVELRDAWQQAIQSLRDTEQKAKPATKGVNIST